MKPWQKIVLFLIFFSVITAMGFSQCAMCTAVADEASKSGSSAADGVNKGVLYLFLSPYLIVGTIGFLWWRARRKAQERLAEENAQALV